MYWLDKFEYELEKFREIFLLLIFFPIFLWILNGGKNDWGVIHHLAIYLTLTNLAILLLVFVIFIFMSIHDILIWMFK